MKFKEAQFYKKLQDKQVHCFLCPHSCFIENGEVGKCEFKQNVNGELKNMIYGKPYEVSTKKIEDIGFYHFMPNSKVLNVGTPGETLSGDFWKTDISGKELKDIPIIEQTPAQVIKQAEKNNCKTISYGFGEPVVFYEYMDDIMQKGEGIKNVIVTNGFIERSAVREISKKAKAIMFDVRSMTNEFYERLCEGKLEPILSAIKTAHKQGILVEIKMNLISRLHGSFYDVKKLISWILTNLDADVPLHFNVFDDESKELAGHARKIAIDAGMNYVYINNLDWDEGRTTFCPNCKKAVVIRRKNDFENYLKNGRCICGQEISGVWQ